MFLINYYFFNKKSIFSLIPTVISIFSINLYYNYPIYSLYYIKSILNFFYKTLNFAGFKFKYIYVFKLKHN